MISLLLLALICATPAWGLVRHEKYTFYVAERAQSPYLPAHIYYPDPLPEGKPVPLIVFAHCYLGAGRWYHYVADALVPTGYVMVSIDTEDYQVVNTPALEAQDQEYAVQAARQEAFTNTSSPLYGLLNNLTGAMGHSMGGGATVITGGTGLVQSIMTLSGEYDNDVDKAAKKTTIPALVMTGSDDCICPPDKDGLPIYNALTSPCKYYINLMNATHCHFDEINQVPDTACEVAEIPCLDGHQIPKETQWALVQRYVVPWFDFSLKGSESAKSLLDQYMSSDQSQGVLYQSMKSCNQTAVL